MAPPRSAVVVGRGIIGCSLARELARGGTETMLVDGGPRGGEASAAAAGMLSPQADALPPGPFFDLALESRDLYPRWAEELAAETGIDVGYRRTGILRCEAGGQSGLSERLRWQRDAGLPIEEVDRARLAELSGGLLNREVPRGFFFPEDGVVDPVPLVRALGLSAERSGVRILRRCPVRRFTLEGGACTGVEMEGERGEPGRRLEADCVVDAAGAWASFDARVPGIVVEPVRGQIVELVPRRPIPTVAWSEEAYLVPRVDGRILVGSTDERVGFVPEVTAGGVARLVAAACRLVPELDGARFSRAWAGLRPAAPDGLPILGASAVAGLWIAAAHYRSGILLAPLTARLLARAIAGESALRLRPFSPERFAAERPLEESSLQEMPSVRERRDEVRIESAQAGRDPPAENGGNRSDLPSLRR